MIQLNIEQRVVDECRSLAEAIASGVIDVVSSLTTVSVERTILRLWGLNEADSRGIPLANRVVDALRARLDEGVSRPVGVLMSAGMSFEAAVRELIRKGPPSMPESAANWREPVDDLAAKAVGRMSRRKSEREDLMRRLPVGEQPWFYCIVATGNIYEDAVQAAAAARQGAQVIAVIRSTAQSLFDYVPDGPTSEGYAGTFATQANFRIMRSALDDIGEELGRYILLCNYCSGLCMPEIAALGALERLDMMLNDAMYGIIFRNINMRRTLTDQFFSRRINGFAGIIINTGEDNYMKTDEGLSAAHTVLASQFINEQLAAASRVPESQTGLGHAFELDPSIENGFLYELAHALLSRQIFPGCPLKYMPPTRYKTGDIFRGYLQDGLFNWISVVTGQNIQLLGMLSEAVQTPGIHDRYLALQNAGYVRRNLKDLGAELRVEPGGVLEKRAGRVLGECRDLLAGIADTSLFDALEDGVFAGIPRGPREGRGLEGVVARGEHYYNPFERLL